MNILFQGDSVTDAGRGRDVTAPNTALGQGYATMVAGRLSAKYDDLNFFNHGVSGNRAADLYGRWQEDTLNFEFDVLSILLGINDVGFSLRLGRGSDKERFRFLYDRMIYEALEKNPDAKLILMEPFVLKMKYAWENFGTDIYDNFHTWSSRVRENGQVTKDLAKKYHAQFVPLFDVFESLTKSAPAERYSVDCIHPTAAGHEIIAEEWVKAWKKIKKGE